MQTGTDLLKTINQTAGPAFWWLGQLGIALKTAGKVLYFDAYLAEDPGRKVAPLFRPAEIDNADFILGSHDHLDHIDWKVWGELAKSSPKAKFIAPRAVIDRLGSGVTVPHDRLIGLTDGETYEADGIRITALASAHELLDPDPETGCYPYLGYVVESGECTVYHSGDTCVYEGLLTKLKQWDLDAMFLPINGRDAVRYRQNIIGNMTYQEAVDLAGLLGPGLVVPCHYDMFGNNHEDPFLFEDYLTAKFPGQNYWIGRHGETVAI